MYLHKNKRGFTLVEIIITCALVGIVAMAIMPMIRFAGRAQQATSEEYQLQTQMRIASESITQHMRHATVGFTVTEAQYETGRTAGWSYFALENDNRQIVHYQWNAAANRHDVTVVVAEQPNISYNLTFRQDRPGSKLIQFQLDGFVDGNSDYKMSVASDLVALNSVVVQDVGTALEPAVALAYREENTPVPQTVVTQTPVRIAVTLVLDTSGSMSFDMNGNEPPNYPYYGSIPPHDTSNVRIANLKARANELIDRFASMGNVSVSIIPFAANANGPGVFRDAATSAGDLKTQINGLSASGGTNVGDGMRRAYYRLQEFNNATTDDVVSYMILLVDGNPTYYSTNNNGTYQTGSGNISNLSGSGNDSSQSEAMAYVSTIGSQLITGGTVDITTFVIGFTANSSEVSRARSIAETYCTHATDPDRKGTYYAASSSVELAAVFDTITSTILEQTWHVYGPY